MVFGIRNIFECVTWGWVCTRLIVCLALWTHSLKTIFEPHWLYGSKRLFFLDCIHIIIFYYRKIFSLKTNLSVLDLKLRHLDEPIKYLLESASFYFIYVTTFFTKTYKRITLWTLMDVFVQNLNVD